MTEETAATPALMIDATGLICPLPVIELARRISTVAIGDVVELRADDPAAKHDVPAWCSMRRHDYLGQPAPATFHVRRSH